MNIWCVQSGWCGEKYPQTGGSLLPNAPLKLLPESFTGSTSITVCTYWSFCKQASSNWREKKKRLKVRARWGAANISCLSTKRSKKWAKVCKKGQKYLQIRLSVWILITFQLLFADRHKIVSPKFNVKVKQHTMWIILSVSLDLSVFVCWPNRFTDRIVPMCLTGPMGID